MHFRHFLRLFVLCMAPAMAVSQQFNDWAGQILTLDSNYRKQAADLYILNHRNLPIIEQDTLVYFVTKNRTGPMYLAGDPTNWAPSLAMKRIEGTDWWYLEQKYPAQARFEYKFVDNQKTYLPDTLNPHQTTGGYGTNSELVMPGYQAAEESTKIPLLTGMLIDTGFQSKAMKEFRRVTIYLPPGYVPGRKYPVIYLHDGVDYLKYGRIQQVFDNLASGERPLALIAVLIHPEHRDSEYSGRLTDSYTRYISTELIPFIDQHYPTLTSRNYRLTMGISNGGNIALWLGASHPELFGGVAAHSSNVEKSVLKALASGKQKQVRFYHDIGLYDIPELMVMHSSLVNLLEKQAYIHSSPIYPEGHNWGFWRNHTAEAIRFLLP